MGTTERAIPPARGQSGPGAFESQPSSSIERFSPGETIARQGESAETIHRIVSGTVQARIMPGAHDIQDDDAIDRRAWPVAVATRTAGRRLSAQAGEQRRDTGIRPGASGALLAERVCSLIAVTDVTLELTRVSAERLERMVLEQPGLGLALAEDLARRTVEATYGVALMDGRLRELDTEIERHEEALDRLVEALAARSGQLGRAAGRARKAASARRGRRADGRASGSSGRSSGLRAARDCVVELSGEGDATELAAGEWLCREGDVVPPAPGRNGRGAPAFLVLAGEIEILARGRRLGVARENELAGAIATLLPGARRRPFGLRAVRPTRIVRIPGEGLGELARSRPELAVHLVRTLSRRLAGALRAAAEVQEDLAAAGRRLDGAERSLASDFAALGKDLVDLRDEAPEAVRDAGSHLADIKGRARRAAEEQDRFEDEFLAGATLGGLLVRREFGRAEASLTRAFDILRGRPGAGGDTDASEAVRMASRAINDHACAGPAMAGLDAGDARFAAQGADPGEGARSGLERHCVGTAAWALFIAERIGCGERESRDIALAALIHDIGMLRAETGLDFAMESHPTEYATAYLARLTGLPPVVVPAVCEHHEFVDGSGYPRRLTGERMCAGGKVLSLANQVDLLLARGLSPASVARALTAESSRYDPVCLSAALGIIGENTGAAATAESPRDGRAEA